MKSILMITSRQEVHVIWLNKMEMTSTVIVTKGWRQDTVSNQGLLYKTELLEVSSEVRSKPLGQKRKRGRPKKLPACLTKSPQPQIPNSTYHSPSPNVSLNLTLSPTGDSSTPPQSQATRRSPKGNQIVSIIRNQKRSRELEEFSDLPPAKQKSRAQKVKIVDNELRGLQKE